MFSSLPVHSLSVVLLLVLGGSTRAETVPRLPIAAAPVLRTARPLNIASALQQLAERMQADGVTARNVRQRHPESYTTPVVRVDSQGRLHTAILVTTFDAQAEAALAAQQVRLEAVHRPARLVQAWIPFDRLEAVAALPFVRYLRPPSYAQRR